MSKNTTVQMTYQADSAPDALTEVIRNGARALLAEAVQAELEELLQAQRSRLDARGRRAVVRNGYLPERQVQTGIGSVSVSVPKVRDRSGSGITTTPELSRPTCGAARISMNSSPGCICGGSPREICRQH